MSKRDVIVLILFSLVFLGPSLLSRIWEFFNTRSFLVILPIIVFLFLFLRDKREKDEDATSKQPTELQKRFQSFPPEVQWTIAKSFLDLVGSAISNKMAVLPSLSAISVAMIAAVTLNPGLLPITLFQAKVLISILLIFIPVSLIIYIYDAQDGAVNALKHYEEYTGVNPRTELKSTPWDYVKGTTPLLMAFIFLSIVIFILEIMWNFP